jgi:putative sporulation protein YtxC
MVLKRRLGFLTKSFLFFVGPFGFLYTVIGCNIYWYGKGLPQMIHGWEGRRLKYLISFDQRDEPFRSCLQDLREGIRSVCPAFDMKEMGMGERCVILIRLKQWMNEKQRDRIAWQVGKILTRYICDHLEPKWISKMIHSSHHYFTKKEIRQIQQLVLEQLETSAWECQQVIYRSRREKLEKQITGFLKENHHIALDGFVSFRLKTYRKTLMACVEETIQAYRLKRQYHEFIELLRIFIESRPPKIGLVHVIHDNQQFHVLKADGTPVLDKDLEPVFMEMADQTASQKDYLMSILLSMTPERIIIHTTCPDENVIKTLMQIFEGRVMTCDGCSQCQPSARPFLEDA